jgi:hypothetical protein
MDDKEYYSLMNRTSSWALQQALKKKNASSKNVSAKGKNTANPSEKNQILYDNAQSYTSLELRQGRADAEMLIEKNSSTEI